MGFYDNVKKETLDPLGDTNNGFANGTSTGPAVGTQPANGAAPASMVPPVANANPVAGGNTGDPQDTTIQPAAKAAPLPAASTAGNGGEPNSGMPMPTTELPATIGDGATLHPPGSTTPTGYPQVAMPGPGSGPAASNGPVDTVEARMARMLGENSPLLERARTLGIQTANARGVPVSSMAEQAIEEAMVNAVRPIAEADAAATNQTNIAREQMANQASISANETAARVAIANAGLQQAQQQLAAQMEMTRAGWAHDDAMGAQNFERNMAMFNTQLAASRSDAETARLFASQQQYNQSILALQTDPNMDQTQRASQISALNTLYGGITYSGKYLNLVSATAPAATNTTTGGGGGGNNDTNSG